MIMIFWKIHGWNRSNLIMRFALWGCVYKPSSERKNRRSQNSHLCRHMNQCLRAHRRFHTSGSTWKESGSSNFTDRSFLPVNCLKKYRGIVREKDSGRGCGTVQGKAPKPWVRRKNPIPNLPASLCLPSLPWARGLGAPGEEGGESHRFRLPACYNRDNDCFCMMFKNKIFKITVLLWFWARPLTFLPWWTTHKAFFMDTRWRELSGKIVLINKFSI